MLDGEGNCPGGETVRGDLSEGGMSYTRPAAAGLFLKLCGWEGRQAVERFSVRPDILVIIGRFNFMAPECLGLGLEDDGCLAICSLESCMYTKTDECTSDVDVSPSDIFPPGHFPRRDNFPHHLGHPPAVRAKI